MLKELQNNWTQKLQNKIIDNAKIQEVVDLLDLN